MNFARTMIVSTAAVVFAIAPAEAADVEGTIKLGGVIVDEEAGDLSVMQETYNIYEGFSATQLRLSGTLNPRTYFTLSLDDINLDNRRSDFELRAPGRFGFFARHDRHRRVFDADRVLNSTRRDLRVGAWAAPSEWVKISADYGRQTRDGERLGFPVGTASALGDGYDDELQTGRIEGEVRKGERALAVAYDFSDYSDRNGGEQDRSGYVVSARLRIPRVLSDKVTHLLRAAYGEREAADADTDHALQNFQYTGVAMPVRQVQLKYNFHAGRIEDGSTRLRTDNFRNNFDATYFHSRGFLFGGYGYETNDDERSLTSYHTYRLGGSVRGPKDLAAKVEYANRSKKDEEKLTLLQDIETATFTAKFQAGPVDGLLLGAGFKDRRRDFYDIGVEAVGQKADFWGRYAYDGWGSAGGEYTFAKDEYDNLTGGFSTESHIVTGRAYYEQVKDLKLGGGLTFLDVGGDLDIQKSILFFEAEYTVRENYRVEVKYNVYNYDDYVLIDRYYTANIVWINVAYDFDFQSD